jgi:uncharacterized protein involved in outer membrane biogenesis
MDRPPTRRRGRLIRIVARSVGGVIMLAIAGIAVIVATFDPNSRKPQIIAAVEEATGRELTIGGRIGLSFLPQPTLQVSDVALSNPPGFSRPDMATLQGLELRLALLPLLSREIRIDELVLRQPDILLETNAKGQANWELAPIGSIGVGATGAGALGAGSPGASSPGAGSSSAAPSPPPPESSPPDNSAAEPPPRIALSILKIEGGTLAMRDASGRTTALVLKQLTAQETTPSAPLHLTMDASYNGTPVNLTADTGPLGGLMGGAGLREGTGRMGGAGPTGDAGLTGDVSTPWPVKLSVTVAGAKLSADGTVAQPAAGRGLAVTVSADIPDLAALSPLAGTTLPPLKTIAAQLKLSDTDGGNGVAISDLALSVPNADLTGSLSLQRGARPLIKANLSSRHIDLDAIARAVSPAAPREAEKPAAPAAQSGPTAPVAQSGPTATAARSSRVIPDSKLPFAALRLADTDLQLAVEDLRTGGQDYKSVKLHAVAADGKLTLDPLTFDAPGGQVDVTATVDSNAAPPPVTLTLRAPGLALQPLLKALGKPGYASGTLELRADLRGAGDTPHDIAASLDGAAGAAVAKGEIDTRLLASLMATLLRQTELPQLAKKTGMSALNCFALRLDATGGIGTLRALRLESSTLGMTGQGTLNFGTETLDLHLRPTAGLGGTTITAPLIVDGTFADRSVHADVAGTVAGNGGTAAKLAPGARTGGLALIIGSAVDRKLSGDPCAEPLALARFVQPPDASSQSDGSAPAAGQKPAKPAKDPLNALKKVIQ